MRDRIGAWYLHKCNNRQTWRRIHLIGTPYERGRHEQLAGLIEIVNNAIREDTITGASKAEFKEYVKGLKDELQERSLKECMEQYDDNERK